MHFSVFIEKVLRQWCFAIEFLFVQMNPVVVSRQIIDWDVTLLLAVFNYYAIASGSTILTQQSLVTVGSFLSRILDGVSSDIRFERQTIVVEELSMVSLPITKHLMAHRGAETCLWS